MGYKVVLDRAAVGRILTTGALPNAVTALANTIASNVRLPAGDGEVVVEPYTTDRGAAAVVVKHKNAVGLQAKHGILTTAAAAAGVQVKARSR